MVSKQYDFLGVASVSVVLDTDPDVLTPTNYALTFGKLLWSRGLKGRRVLDVGSGSGILAIVAAMQGADVWAVDIAPRARELTLHNATLNNVTLANVVESDVLSAFLPGARYAGEKFDLIVCNNPSLPGKASTELSRAGYREWNENGDGRYILDAILTQGRQVLRPGGSLITHTSSEQDWKRTAQILGREWKDWETLLAIELPIDGPYYDGVRSGWIDDGSAYVKRGVPLHLVTIFEAFERARDDVHSLQDKLVSQRLIREIIDL